MIWLSLAAFAHDDPFPSRVDDRSTRARSWRHEEGQWISPTEVPEGGGSRVSALVEVPDGGELPLLQARGRSGAKVGDWVDLEETFHGDGQRVAVVDLGRVWAEAELRVSEDEEGRVGELAWELTVPAFPDAGRRARASSLVAPFPAPLPFELLAIGVTDRLSWGARPTGCSLVEDDWYRMAIHHTAGNPTDAGTVLGAVQVLQAYAQDSGEYCDTPYQFLVGYDGSLWEGRSLAYQSGATGGGNNDGNIAVCFLGCYHPDSCPNGAGDPASDEMIDGAQLLVQTLTELHAIPSDADSIRGHRDWPGNATACPGEYVYDRLDELRTDLAWFSGTEVARSHPAGVPIVLQQGESVELWVDLENTGGLPWTPGSTHLGTTDPRDAPSPLWGPTWVSETRPATVSEEVSPGEVGHFAFTVVGEDPGEFPASFGLVQEWVTWFGDAPWGGGPGDDLLAFDLVVEAPEETDPTTPATTEPPGATVPEETVPTDPSDPRRLPLERGGCSTSPVPAGWLGVMLGALLMRRRVALAALFVPVTASAFDWTEVRPGIRYTEEVRPGPIRLFLADIDTCMPGVRFRAVSPTDGTSPRVTSNFAQSVGAVLATNGDFYDHDFGLNLGEGIDWAPYLGGLSDGRDRASSGNFAVGPDRIEMIPDYEVLPGPEPWMQQVVSGRWTLLEDGVAHRGIADGGYVCSPGLRHPRTVLGQSADGRHVYMLVADGRGAGGSIGITCDEVIDVMLELGASDAMGLDGGGSSTMYLEGLGVVNHPSDGHERSVLSHLGVYADGVGPAPHCGEHAAAPIASPPVGPVEPVGAPGLFEPLSPVRLFDTRGPQGALLGASLDASGKVLGQTSFGFQDFGLPADTTGVWINVAATEPEGPGFVTVWPGGSPLPLASNLGYAAGETVSNAALVGLQGGRIDLYTLSTTHLVADLQGRLSPNGAGWVPETPHRLLDTRTSGLRLEPGVPIVVAEPVAAPQVAALLDVVSVDPALPGFVSVFPCAAGVPATSNLNFDAGEEAAGAVSVGSESGICAVSNVQTDLVVDQVGTWTQGTGLSVQSVVPLRVLDTRTGIGGWQGRVKPGQVVTLPLSSSMGWPADGQAAVLEVTVDQPTAPGFLTVYPCADTVPLASSLNFDTGRTVANLVPTALSQGSVCLYASASAHLIVDLAAVGLGAPVALAPAEALPGSEGGQPSCATTQGGGGVLGLLALLLVSRRRAHRG